MKRNRDKFLEKLLWAIFVAAGLLFCTGCNRTEKYTTTGTAMGTMIHQTVYTDGEDVTSDITALLTKLEEETLSWRISESEVAGINAMAGEAEGILLSEEMEEILQVLLEVSVKSNGAFDITMHPVVQLWNIDGWAAKEQGEQAYSELWEQDTLQRENESEELGLETVSYELPTSFEIEQALSHTGYEALSLKEQRLLLPVGMSLDLGAAGKGIACDSVAEYLTQTQVCGAVISVGGSVVTYGEKEDGLPWQVGIVNPQDTAKLLGTLSLRGTQFVSTSGDYERYVEMEGVRYHHILNPATGYPANNGISSVTIVCNSGILSDALSTACFVLGVEEGMKLAEGYGAKALFVDKTGQIFMTEGMKGIFQETGDK